MCLNFLYELKIEKVIQELDNYDTLLFHKNIAKAQRNAYNEHRTVEHLRDKILIELDYKQKIKIGLSPRQITAEYYNQEERTCLGKF